MYSIDIMILVILSFNLTSVMVTIFSYHLQQRRLLLYSLSFTAFSSMLLMLAVTPSSWLVLMMVFLTSMLLGNLIARLTYALNYPRDDQLSLESQLALEGIIHTHFQTLYLIARIALITAYICLAIRLIKNDTPSPPAPESQTIMLTIHKEPPSHEVASFS